MNDTTKEDIIKKHPERIVVVKAETETDWFQALLSSALAVVFVTRPHAFPGGGFDFPPPPTFFPTIKTDWLDAEDQMGVPTQGQAIFYYGNKPETFIEEFEKFGWKLNLRYSYGFGAKFQ